MMEQESEQYNKKWMKKGLGLCWGETNKKWTVQQEESLAVKVEKESE